MDISSLNHDLLIRYVMGRLSGQMLEHSIHDVMRHERLAVVLSNMSADRKPSFTPQVAEKLAGIVVLNNDRFLGSGQNINNMLAVKRYKPLDVKVIGSHTQLSELLGGFTDRPVRGSPTNERDLCGFWSFQLRRSNLLSDPVKLSSSLLHHLPP